MMLVSTISYVDRNTLALLSPTILRDTHLNNEQYGYIILAFSLAYMLTNPLWGWILDRIGVRTGMTAAVSLWTLASVSHAFASGMRSFAIARGVLGFGEGATFPGGLRTVVQTLPVQMRSRGIAIAYSGGSLGALITPIIITPIARRFGWQGAFWFTGAIGAAWLAMWAMLSRRPELRHAPKHVAPVDGEGATHPRWWDTRLLAFIAAYALGAFPSGFVLYQAANFFSASMHKSQVEIGHVLWIPPLGWELGYFFWGWVIDRFAGAGGKVRAMRRIFLLAMLLSLPLAGVGLVNSFEGVLAIMFLVMFMASAFIIGAVAYATSHYSTKHSGWLAGVGAGTWSAVVGGVMPMMGRLFDQHRYEAAFAIAAMFPVLGYILWRALDLRTTDDRTADDRQTR
jgi:ACS family hexuronate transporter-like MFS transporter